METVTFIVADTDERIRCQLNPERLVQQRTAGLRRPVAGSGPVTGPQASDDLLLHTGGGRTEMDLELLFDIETSSTNANPSITDVRDLTRPLWQLAENPSEPRQGVHAVRFCWGLWNVLCVVAAVAERLERFDATGAPTRSWLSLRLVRVPDPTPAPIEAPANVPSPAAQIAAAVTAPSIDFHVPVDPGRDAAGETAGGERLDEIASRYYGSPWLWRVIAAANGLYDSVFAPPGRTLTIPEPPAQP